MIEEQKQITLTDNRKMTWFEFGSSTGQPVVLLHGAPGYSLYWTEFPEYPFDHKKYRFISVDRRGYGTSDYKENTTYLNYIDDIVELLDYLKIDKVTVLGISGGGPFALACGYKIPERIEQVAVVSSAGDIKEKSIENAISNTNRRVYKIARKFPWLMNLNMRLLISWQRKNPEKFLEKMSYKLSGPDKLAIKSQNVISTLKNVYLNSYEKTWKGYARDVILQANDWDFDLSEISVPVKIFQANDDTSSPEAVGEYFHRTIQNSKLYNYENAGHLWHILNFNEILGKL